MENLFFYAYENLGIKIDDSKKKKVLKNHNDSVSSLNSEECREIQL